MTFYNLSSYRMAHLTLSQREQLHVLYQLGHSQRFIADFIGCHQSTICRELQRNMPQTYQRYTATVAQRNAMQRRRSSFEKRRHWYDNPAVLQYVIEKLRLRWSPEQIAGRMKRESPWHREHAISAKSIYVYIWQMKEVGGCLHCHLRRRGKRPKWFGMRQTDRIRIPNRRDITQRSKTIEKRLEIGHWESDLVIGTKQHSAIATFAERYSRYCSAVFLAERTAAEMCRAARETFRSLPKALRQTMTHDNGSEIAKHEQITNETGVIVYCARPYASWQRGLNENTNGLLRDFFPKGTDFNAVSQRELDRVVHLINTRPRHCLNYRTAKEVFDAFHSSE